MNDDEWSPYCKTCGSCGEMGCCNHCCDNCIDMYQDDIDSGGIVIECELKEDGYSGYVLKWGD